MNPEIANPTTSAPGASVATPPMTPSTMPETESAGRALSAITNSPRSLTGKNRTPTRQELLAAIQGDELVLQLHHITLEAYKPAMDAIKKYLEIFGSQSPNFYMTKNKQVIAACQMQGINDPTATRKQRIAATACYEMLLEAILRSFELGLKKEEVKKAMNDAINSAAEFFGLGNKKAVAQREKAKRKAA
jgi:hypothetical protein